jgi:hypothetical protein
VWFCAAFLLSYALDGLLLKVLYCRAAKRRNEMIVLAPRHADAARVLV